MLPTHSLQSFKAVLLLLFISLAGCDQPTESVDNSITHAEPSNRPFPSSDHHQTPWKQLVKTLDHLRLSLAQLANAPTEKHLASSRKLWLMAFEQYQRLAAWRILLSSHYQDQEPNTLLEQRIAPWPIAPGYVDRLPEYPHSGIISDHTVMLSLESLMQQHQLFHEEDAVLGFHAIATVLWAANTANEDISLSQLQTSPDLHDNNATPIHQRRLAYLKLAGEQLHLDVKKQRQLALAIHQQADNLSYLDWQKTVTTIANDLIKISVANTGQNDSFVYPACGPAPCNEQVPVWFIEGLEELATALRVDVQNWKALQNLQKSHFPKDLKERLVALAALHHKPPVPPREPVSENIAVNAKAE